MVRESEGWETPRLDNKNIQYDKIINEEKMYIVMNKFKIISGKEKKFEEVWKNRNSNLDGVPGFLEFHLIKGMVSETHTVYASHSSWNSQEDFYNWVKSEVFREAHKHAGQNADLYMGGPQLEEYEVVI